MQARARQGLIGSVPSNVRSKLVPRVIKNTNQIVTAVNAVINSFEGRAHEEMGELITSKTKLAWSALEHHVKAGCLCDPPGINMNKFGEAVLVGGEEFPTIRTQRGVSSLEGFHTHQKNWLGPLARHASDSGQALLTDGAVRWNRKRNATLGRGTLPPVFGGGVMQTADDLHQRLCGERLYPGLVHSEAVEHKESRR